MKPIATFLAVLLLALRAVCAQGQPKTDDEATSRDVAAPTQDFNKQIRPSLISHCVRCHDAEKATSGIRVDHLDASFADGHLKLWSVIQKQLSRKAMPPEDEAQPTSEEPERVERRIGGEISVAPDSKKNGGAQRLTVAHYRNTRRELLLLDDDPSSVLSPDAKS